MVLYNSVSSDTLPATHETPEGSFMVPALFLIYINDLTSLPEPNTLAYANDLTLIASDGTADMAALIKTSVFIGCCPCLVIEKSLMFECCKMYVYNTSR